MLRREQLSGNFARCLERGIGLPIYLLKKSRTFRIGLRR